MYSGKSKSMFWVVLAGFLFFCLSPDLLSASRWCVTPESAYSFADQLYEKQDYKAAATEFLRFVHFFPDHDLAAKAAYMAGMAFFSGQQPREAIDAFDNVVEMFPESSQATESMFMISRCLLKLNENRNADAVLKQIIDNAKDPETRDRALNERGWLLLESNDIPGAKDAFRAIARKNQQFYNTREILSAIDDPGRVKYKNPAAAGLISVVPGGGYMYTGRYREAGIAFFLTTVLAVASWQCFEEDLPALGVISGLAGLGFYSGSIAGAVSSAHKYNRQADRRFIENLKNLQGPGFSFNLQSRGVMIGFHCPF